MRMPVPRSIAGLLSLSLKRWLARHPLLVTRVLSRGTIRQLCAGGPRAGGPRARGGRSLPRHLLSWNSLDTADLGFQAQTDELLVAELSHRHELNPELCLSQRGLMHDAVRRTRVMNRSRLWRQLLTSLVREVRIHAVRIRAELSLASLTPPKAPLAVESAHAEGRSQHPPRKI